MELSKYKQFILSVATGGLLLAGLFSLLTETPQIAYATPSDLFVTSTGSGDCSQSNPCDLQTALGLASDGDTIYVAAGTYTGTGEAVIVVTKSITLYGGWDGTTTTPPVRDPAAHPTTLDGERERRVVHISGNISATVDGFTITGGNASNAPTDAGRGGGIYSARATSIIANNVVTNNIAYTSAASRGYGGGIYVSNPPGVAVITGNQVLSNVASTSYYAYGGGIYLGSASSAQVVNNVVLSNTASITDGLGYGGGLVFSGSDGILVTGNRVEYNVGQAGLAPSFGSKGGGVYCYGSDDVMVSSNVVRHNTASIPANGGGGGIGISGCDRLIVVGNTLQGNLGSASTTSGGGRGGGLSAYASRGLTINANRVLSNTASLSQFGWGGGLYLSRNTTFTMTNNIVAVNQASREGGGMAFETSVAEPVAGTLAHNTFAANDRGSGYGRIAIHLNNSYVTLVLTNNLIYSHTYGVYATAGSTATLYHTLFYAHSSGDTGGPGSIVNTDPITGQDPLLTADYHLQGGSPAIDAGLTLPWLTADIDGDTRPQGSGYDIGADEFIYRYRVYLPLVVRGFP